MVKNSLNKRMNEEIRSRMESRSWNMSMAASVLEQKKKRKRDFFILWTSASSLAAVSLTVFIVLFGTGEKTVDKDYSDFISTQLKGTYETVFYDGSKTGQDPDKKKSFVAQQVRGTYKAVFVKNDSTGIGSVFGTGDILSSHIDTMIDNTLAQR